MVAADRRMERAGLATGPPCFGADAKSTRIYFTTFAGASVGYVMPN
jgi:hypothetical protein